MGRRTRALCLTISIVFVAAACSDAGPSKKPPGNNGVIISDMGDDVGGGDDDVGGGGGDTGGGMDVDTDAANPQDAGRDLGDTGDNRAPVADAGDDATGMVDETMTLDGTASYDPDGDALTYEWTLVDKPTGSTPTLQNFDGPMPRFTPDSGGTYEFSLVVSDGVLSSAPDDLVITVDGGEQGECLVFSEYLEGSSNNKAIEVYNCGGASIDLSKVGVCYVINDDTTCSGHSWLSGNLASGAVHGMCHFDVDPLVVPTTECDTPNAGAASFNGNDRLVLFRDEDDSQSLTGQDTIFDAFGQTFAAPSGTPWANVTHRRCDWSTYYDGTATFQLSQWYTTHSEDDFSDFGTPPSANATCP